MFSPYHTSGFYYAPITKVVLCSMVASTFAVSFPLVHYRRLFHSIAPETVFEKHNMSSDSLESTILAICGIVSGLIYRHNVLWLQSVLSVPTCIGRGFHTTVGGMLYSSPPQEASRPIGATLEIQRSQRMEELEQQIAIRQINQHRHANPGAGIFGNLPLQRNVAAANQQPGIFGNLPLQPNVAAANHQQQQPEPGEELVQTLVDMGFGRDSAMQALRATNNDLSLATNVLLHQQ